MNTVVSKPLLTGLIAGVLHNVYIGEKNMTSNSYFATAVAVGNYGSQYVYPLVKQITLPSISKSLYDTPTLIERISEVGSASAMAYLLNRYVLNNEPYRGEVMKTLAVIAASDFIATYALEYVNGQKLEFLTNE